MSCWWVQRSSLGEAGKEREEHHDYDQSSHAGIQKLRMMQRAWQCQSQIVGQTDVRAMDGLPDSLMGTSRSRCLLIEKDQRGGNDGAVSLRNSRTMGTSNSPRVINFM